jgi:DNA-binding MarR family transcriptional regulator
VTRIAAEPVATLGDLKPELSETAERVDAELAARLRLALTRLSRQLRGHVASSLSASQASALSTVMRLGSPTLGELAASEQVRPPSMTRLISYLEHAGLVERQVDRADRRVVRVRVTGLGRRTLHRNRSLRDAFLVERLRRFDDVDREQIAAAVAFLERLAQPG